MNAKVLGFLFITFGLFGCQKSDVEKCTESYVAMMGDKMGTGAVTEATGRMECLRAQSGQK